MPFCCYSIFSFNLLNENYCFCAWMYWEWLLNYQITGDLVSVQEALYHVTGRLRDNQFSNKVQNGAGMRKSGHELTALTRRMGNLGVSYNLDGSPQVTICLSSFSSFLWSLNDFDASKCLYFQTGTELNSRNELDNGKELNSVNGVELGRLASRKPTNTVICFFIDAL